jgi:hypothetical protein
MTLGTPLAIATADAGGAAAPGWILRLLQALLMAGLIWLALGWITRSTARGRQRLRGSPERPLLAYPLWVPPWAWVACCCSPVRLVRLVGASQPRRSGRVAGVPGVRAARGGAGGHVVADTFVLDEEGLERLGLGRCRRIAWGEVVRVAVPWGGQGIRLEPRDGRRLEVAELLDGFGRLCGALLLHVPPGVRVSPRASLLVLRGSGLDPEPLQLAYARWFEGEEAEPPEGMGPEEWALAMGLAFRARLLWRYGSFLPFEARWTVDGRARLSQGEPRGSDPGYARFRLKGRDVAIESDAGVVREPLEN